MHKAKNECYLSFSFCVPGNRRSFGLVGSGEQLVTPSYDNKSNERYLEKKESRKKNADKERWI